MSARPSQLVAQVVGLFTWAACSFSCASEPEITVAATQLLVSVDFVPPLREQADGLRAAIWTREASVWEPGSQVTVPTAGLRWPVDLPILPSRPAHEDAEVELVVEAMKGSNVLAQARVLSRFVPRQHRALSVSLAACAGHPAGFVCAEPGCHGDQCTVCGPTGSCIPVVPTTGQGSEPTGDAGVAPRDGGGASADASNESDARTPTPGTDAGEAQLANDAGPATIDGGSPDVPGADAGAPQPSPDAGPVVPVCPVDHGCKAPYPCVPTALGYTCRGQFADWPMPDGFESAKYKHSFTSDGVTVVDAVTKLEWETNVPEVHTGCTYDSGSGKVGEFCNLSEARAHCDKSEVGAKDDWRVPSMIELATLLDHSRIDYRYAIDADYFPDINWSAYVTNSLYPGSPASYRSVDFVQRSTWAGQRGELRCVRGGAEPPFATPAGRYTVDTAANTVTDNATQLVWQRTGSPQAFAEDAPEIAAYCKDGFRLPTPNELLTLVDPTREKPAVDSSAFPDTQLAKYWTVFNDRGSAVSFVNGDMGIYAEGETGYVRCVR